MKFGKFLSPVLLFLACFPSGARAQTSTIALVQHTGRDAGTATSATLAFNFNNTTGNWIGVCVRAGHSGEIFTVTDSRGNAYHRAVQLNVTVDTPSGDTLGIFYAENIAGGANTVTVSDSISGTMRFSVVEYSGVATANSLDVIAMAQGNGVSPNSGSVTTSNGDLLLGAISSANSASIKAGTGFSALDSIPAAPNTKLFGEQQTNVQAGAESALATLGASDNWGAILAAFKGVAGVGPIPSITSISPPSGSVGTAVTITGTNFGTALGTVTFNGTAATPTSWSTTRVVVPVPSGATTGNVVLTDPGIASNGVPFTVTTPDTIPPVVAITSPANNATLSGSTTIAANATDNVAVASVQFKVDNVNTGAALVSAPYSVSLDTTALPDGNHLLTAVATDTSGNATTSATVTVKVNNSPAAPSIATLNPVSGSVGSSVTIAGANFGATQGTSSVTFGGIAAAATGWSATTVSVNVPTGATTGPVIVTVGGVASNSMSFTVTVPAPSIASLNPLSGLVGTSVTITGANFGATQGTSALSFNGVAATPTTWSATSIAVPVPAGATTGNVVVTVGGVATNGVNFAVTVPSPSITNLNPASGLVGASVTISGVNFGTAQGTSSVSFGGIAATVTSWSATSIVTPVPAGATTGNVVVTVGGTASNAVSFTVTVPSPSITNLNPASGLVGTSVTVTGSSFGATQGTSTVAFNGIGATPTGWSPTSITVPVPAGATTGNVVVTVSGAASNGVSFAVTTAAPIITSLNPASGLVGASVTIAGANFGTTQGTSSVIFGGIAATVTSWSATTVNVNVPTGATTGTVILTVGGVASNAVSFTVTALGPSITSLSPSSGSVGTPVTIAGSNFGATQGTSTLTLNGIALTPTSWSATSIVAPVPTGASTGNVVMTVGGAASNGMGFTLTASAPMASVQHTSKDAGTATSATLAFLSNNTAGNWIGVSIRAGHSGQVFTVTDSKGNVYRKAVLFNVSVDPPNGDSLGIYYAENIAGGANTITVSDTISGTLRFAIVEYSGVATANSLDVAAAAQGTSASPNSGSVLSTVNGDLLLSAIMTGNPATYTAGIGNVIRESVPAEPNTKLMVEDQFQPSAGTVSANASLGAGDNWAAALAAFKAATGGANPPPAAITSLTPSSGLVGTSVTISGANFGATQGTSTVKFNGITATPTSWTATSVVAPVPAGATTGNVVVTVGGVASNGVSFTVTAPGPSITNLNPTSGLVGTTVTISGTNFGATQGTNTVSFGGVAGAATSWSAASIAVPVPAGATTGNVVVTAGGVASNGVSFTVSAPAPSITSLNPASGLIGASVTITGANFGATQGSSTVKFNGIAAAPASWSATSIIVPVPAGATTGNVVVTVAGAASNGASFTVQGDTTPPTVSLTAPSAGASVSGTVSVTASASDNVAVASVQFQLDGANLGSLDTVAPYSVSWDTTTSSNGSHTLRAIATDTSNNSTTSSVVTVQVSNSTTPPTVAWPIKASANRRYLVDQNIVPFLLMGDAAHNLIAGVSPSDTILYMTTRAGQGFNAIQVFALCDTYETNCTSAMSSFNGTLPFTSGTSQSNYDLSAPNPAYWSIVDSLLSTAAANNLIVILNPMETGGLLPLLETNGTTKVFNYGVFLGNRYKNTPNLIWDFGNDFQNWNSNPTDNNLVSQLMAGIASVDSNHLMEIELDYYKSYSNQDTATLNPVLSFDAAYTYYETYDCVLQAYNSSPTLPVFMIEANYEFANNNGYFSGQAGAFLLREQEYWTMTSGATGQIYGSHYTNHFNSGWQSNLNSPGALETKYLTQLFGSLPWWNLVPDQTHQIVTSGFGTYNASNGNLTAANYVTTAWVTDGSLAVIYDPAGNALTVNLAKFAGPVTAHWFDPSNGTYTSIAGSPFTNSGSHVFSTPGTNHDGNPDWVLELQ